MIAKKRHFQTLPNDIPHHQRHIISDYVLVLTYLLYIYIYINNLGLKYQEL